MWTAPAIAAIIGVVLGLLMLMTGLGTVINPAGRVRAVREFSASSGMQLLGGILSFALGAAVVIMVPLSTDLLSICVTILGWVMLLKGALLLLWGEGLMGLAHRMDEQAMTVFGWAMTLAGAVLFVSAINALGAATLAATMEEEALVAPDAPAAPESPEATKP